MSIILGLGIGKFSLVLVFFLVMFLPQLANAQDLPPMELPDRKIQKMDSSLATLYEIYQQGGNTSAFIASQGLFDQGDNVRVVIELSSATSTLPQNLGINVETSYENLVQAIVPISNLESISSHENVKLVRMPSEIAPIVSIPVTENDSNNFFNLVYLAIIPAVVIPIIYYKKKKRGG